MAVLLAACLFSGGPLAGPAFAEVATWDNAVEMCAKNGRELPPAYYFESNASKYSAGMYWTADEHANDNAAVMTEISGGKAKSGWMKKSSTFNVICIER